MKNTIFAEKMPNTPTKNQAQNLGNSALKSDDFGCWSFAFLNMRRWAPSPPKSAISEANFGEFCWEGALQNTPRNHRFAHAFWHSKTTKCKKPWKNADFLRKNATATHQNQAKMLDNSALKSDDSGCWSLALSNLWYWASPPRNLRFRAHFWRNFGAFFGKARL